MDDEIRIFEERATARTASASCMAPAMVAQTSRDPDVVVQPCDPAPIVPTPTEFFEANPPPAEVSLPRLLPDALVVRNARQERECQGGSVPVDSAGNTIAGATGVVSAGAVTADVLLETIPSFTQDELYRVAELMPAVQEYLDGLSTSAPVDSAVLQSILVCADASATALASALDAARSTVNLVAGQQAQGQLLCAWVNNHMYLLCDAGASDGYSISPTLPEGLTSPSDYVEVPAAVPQATSVLSTEDADNKAAKLYATALKCVFWNAMLGVDCTYVNAAFVDIASQDGLAFRTVAGVSAYGAPAPASVKRTLVYSASVAAGQYSGRTADEANEKALLAAVAQLDCFFPSAELSLDCVQADSAGPAHARKAAMAWTDDDVLNEMVTGSHTGQRGPDNQTFIKTGTLEDPFYTLDVTPGVKVVVPVGAFAADSQEAANTDALLYAAGLLSCVWTSPAYSCGCYGGGARYKFPVVSGVEVVADQSTQGGALPGAGDPPTIPRGRFQSAAFPGLNIGDADPWTSLDAICKASLNCVFSALATVYCTPRPDERPRMINGEPNKLRFQRFVDLTPAAAAAQWKSAMLGARGEVFPRSTTLTDEEKAAIGDWYDYPQSYGTPAFLFYGGVLAYGNRWDTNLILPSHIDGGAVTDKVQKPDVAKNWFSGAEGRAVGNSPEHLVAEAKLDATGRLKCDHLFFYRKMTRCMNSDETLLSTWERLFPVRAESSAAASIEAELCMVARLVCQRPGAFSTTAATNPEALILTSLNVSVWIGSPSISVACPSALPGILDTSAIGVHPVDMLAEGTNAAVTMPMVYTSGTGCHYFLTADQLSGHVVWRLCVRDSTMSYDAFCAEKESGAAACSDALSILASLRDEKSGPVWYLSSVGMRFVAGDIPESQVWQFQTAPIPVPCAGGGGNDCRGAFSRTYRDDSGNLMLQGGAVKGGTKAHVLADTLLLAHAGTAPADGKRVVMHIGLTAITDDGVVLPGCVLDNTAPTIAVNLSTMPDDTIPDDADPGGDMYILLGHWYDGDFVPSGPGGNITVIHWLGSLTASRSS